MNMPFLTRTFRACQGLARLPCRRFVLCVLAFVAAPFLCAESAERRIELTELLGRGWTNELVAYPFTALAGECVPESIRATGPVGPLAAQFVDVETWPGTRFVRRARVVFVVGELIAGGKVGYTLSYGPTAASTPMPSTDLAVAEAAGSVELTTSRFGVRLPLGGAAHEAPAGPDSVPGPVVAIRLGNTGWTGGSHLYGDSGGVTAWSACLTEKGPVLARARMEYSFAEGSAMTVTVQVAAGDNAAQVEMAVPGGCPGNGWDLALGKAAAGSGIALASGSGVYERTKVAPEPASPTNPVCHLVSWPAVGWFADTGAQVALTLEGAGVPMIIRARDAAARKRIAADPVFLKGRASAGAYFPNCAGTYLVEEGSAELEARVHGAQKLKLRRGASSGVKLVSRDGQRHVLRVAAGVKSAKLVSRSLG